MASQGALNWLVLFIYLSCIICVWQMHVEQQMFCICQWYLNTFDIV